jgi:hypothetical protein
MTNTSASTSFYLARDGDRVSWLVAVQGYDAWSASAYGYVPDLEAFVFNRPLTMDFCIDREMAYEPITADQAATIVDAGQIKRLDDIGMHDRLDEMRSEPRKLALEIVYERSHE